MTGEGWPAAPIWSAAGWTMLHFLWVGSILGILAGIGRRLLRSARAEVQYLYGLAWLAILATTPVIIAGLLSGPLANDAAARPSIPVPVDIAAGRGDATGWTATVPDRALSPVAIRRQGQARGARALAILVAYLPYLWLAGAPITFAYLAVGLAGAERLRRQSVLVGDPRLGELARGLAESLGVARRVALATCGRLSAPVLVGIVRPAILLPTAALTGWTPDQIEMALLHELVHVRRWDNLVILLQRLVESILFFHPVVWVVSGWVHREREHCCDGAVARHTGRPLAYAEALLALSGMEPPRGPVAVAMARGDLVARIRRLLDPEDHSMRLPSTAVALAAGLLLVPVLLLGARAAFSRPDERPHEEGADDPPGTVAARVVGRLEELRRIATEALKAIDESTNKPGSMTLTDIAQAQAKIGDRAAAAATLRRAARAAAEEKQSVVRKGNTVTYGLSSAHHLCRVAQLQAELGDKEAALETLRLALRGDDDREDPRRGASLVWIAKELTGLGARDEALGVAWGANKDYEARGDRSNDQMIVPNIAALHAAAGDIDGAFDVLDRVADSNRPDRIKQVILGRSLGEIAKAVETADRATARKALDRVLQRLEDVPLAEDKYAALIAIADALARIGDFEGALRAARLVGEGPTQADYDLRDGRPYAMLLVAGAQREAGDVEAARKTLREAREACQVLSEARGRSGRLMQVAGSMTAAGDLAGALDCVEDMPAGRRYESLAQIAAAQERGGDRAAARATFRRALEDAEAARGHRPTPGVDKPKFAGVDEPDDARWDAQVAREVAKIRAKMGDFEAARKTADSIADEVWRAFALADVARAQAAAGDARGALEWARDLKKLPRTKPSPLEAIIEGIADSVEAEAARTRPAPDARRP